ncbi:DNA methyltransferase [Dictyobacter vulcani]|uniref:site-specific DNA-methyltransferase (adenine-specific) n=1 Tax=Dictyobacter vulcani TaxID=2607529 RepID=A0A5J4KR94_9CHLR|nr:type I restriction-modification system subunit M [Dictyobacter vulcani]GER88960.1 DNA methyltransferase [Dictyobacter vulcani]
MARRKSSNSTHRSDAQGANQSILPLALQSDGHLSISELETWLWDAACVIRGAADAPKYKDFILPLVFYKRLSDVFEDECQQYFELYGSEELAYEFIKVDHQQALLEGRAPMVRFFVPDEYRWIKVRNHGSSDLGEFVTSAMRTVANLNPTLKGVLDVKDYNERQSGERTLDDGRLAALIEVVSRHRLGLHNAEPDILGRAYEYLLRKFAEGQGQSAGEFYTPKEVGWLIASLINPHPQSTVYDPTCGSGGLLIKSRLYYEEHAKDKAKSPRLFGQELNPVTFAMAKMNMFLHDYTDSSFAVGDTFTKPGFGAEGSGLQQFDYVVANPMWNQDAYEESFYEHDPWGRFQHFGYPPHSSADWAWLQHIYASLNEHGRAAVVLDTGSVSRGSGSKSSNRERDIRKKFVEEDIIECVILLPENLFYNTSAPGVVIMLNRDKLIERKHQILLINASNYFVKRKPKNELTGEGIEVIKQAFYSWEEIEKLSRLITVSEVSKVDYNLSPSQFVDVNDIVTHRSLRFIMEDLLTVKSNREQADIQLSKLLAKLNLDITF